MGNMSSKREGGRGREGEGGWEGERERREVGETHLDS